MCKGVKCERPLFLCQQKWSNLLQFQVVYKPEAAEGGRKKEVL